MGNPEQHKGNLFSSFWLVENRFGWILHEFDLESYVRIRGRMSDFTFYYPIVTIAQEAFRDDNTRYTHGVDDFQTGHIIYQGSLLCGKSMDVRLPSGKKQRKTIRETRIAGVGLCEICQERWKANKNSQWSKWSEGVAKEAGKTLEMIKIGEK